jgi:hypothetical protein
MLVAHDTAAAPVDLEEAPALSWLRDRARLVIEANKPDGAVLRAPEPVAAGNTDSARRRLRVEGVLLEISHAYGMKVATRALAAISAKLGTKSAKSDLDLDEFRGINISKLSKPLREAVLFAVACLPEP